jgi:N5-(cytidine 5'-diphosphoramidyl)-L-glutamine hydrolase
VTMKKLLKIGISSRIVTAPNYDEKRDALSHDWAKFLESMDFLPIIIPNNLSNVKQFLTNVQVDGIILSGGDNIGEFPKRDKTEKGLIKYGIINNIPIFGVCRGMQVINNYFEGSLHQTTNKKHIKKNHEVNIKNEQLRKYLRKKSVKVNSFHNNIIMKNDLGKGLDSFIIDDSDDTVEGFFHKLYHIMGVMWHPERTRDNFNKQIMKKFFDRKLSYE